MQEKGEADANEDKGFGGRFADPGRGL